MLEVSVILIILRTLIGRIFNHQWADECWHIPLFLVLSRCPVRLGRGAFWLIQGWKGDNYVSFKVKVNEKTHSLWFLSVPRKILPNWDRMCAPFRETFRGQGRARLWLRLSGSRRRREWIERTTTTASRRSEEPCTAVLAVCTRETQQQAAAEEIRKKEVIFKGSPDKNF